MGVVVDLDRVKKRQKPTPTPKIKNNYIVTPDTLKKKIFTSLKFFLPKVSLVPINKIKEFNILFIIYYFC